MKFQINSTLFLKALKRAASVIVQKPTIPILETALIRLTMDSMIIHTSNLANHLEITLPFQASEFGEVCVDAKKLLSYLLTLGNQEINISVLENSMVVGHSTGEAKFPTVPAVDFPKFPETGISEFKLWDADELITRLKHLADTAKVDDGFSIMSNIYMHENSMVATDGFTFQMYQIAGSFPSSCLLSKKLILAVVASFESIPDEQIKVGFASNYTLFSAEGIRVSCQNTETKGKYMDYQGIISASFPFNLTANKQDLVTKVKRVDLLSTRDSKVIKFNIDQGELNISSSGEAGLSLAEGKETCECTTSLPDQYTIGFHAADFLKQLSYQHDGDITLHFGSNPRMPIVVKSENSLTLIMTRKIDEVA